MPQRSTGPTSSMFLGSVDTEEVPPTFFEKPKGSQDGTDNKLQILIANIRVPSPLVKRSRLLSTPAATVRGVRSTSRQTPLQHSCESFRFRYLQTVVGELPH